MNLNKGDSSQVQKNQENINNNSVTFYPAYVLDYLDEGMLLRLEFDGALAKVVEVHKRFYNMECS